MQFKKGMIVVALGGQVTQSQFDKGITQRVVRFGDTGTDMKQQARGRRFQRGMVVLPAEKGWRA